MFRRDYLMQQIEQLTLVLHRILVHKEQQQPGKAQELLEEACRHVLGMNPRALAALSGRDILQLLTYNGTVDHGRAVAVAALLLEQGALDEAQGETSAAYALYLKALEVLLELLDGAATDEAAELREWASPQIGKALELLKGKFLPAGLKMRLFAYWEAVGQYAKAEDMLSWWLEDVQRDPAAVAQALREGVAFYERLRERPESELAAGRFSAAEVEEGLAWCRSQSAGDE
ncbi:hypothetical protein B5M42_004640 [Paenibacillus athensensis]|uniref:Uncharacterized protein n=1 Tax=Paenibacillus athensensis TaxID=1967502 RepID=A0A4Y8PSE7_9BACL|nr:DUF6483 family protein [Paenibacillus athensensis]MCD1258126.1 hypothetical protein [Paenibacillus athensensis]